MKKINEQKLQAFAIGTMGKRPLSKKEQEERRKREEETAAAHAFKEFVETFQEAPSTVSKTWIKAGTYDAGSRREDHREKGKLYKPSSKLEEKSSSDKAQEYAQSLSSGTSGDAKRDGLVKKKSNEKKKSNLELFKEELRQIQEEREERFKYKTIAKTIMHHVPEPDFPMLKETEFGSMDNGDPNTTNIYLGNLNPKISEQQLMELFGRYGPLASIKIMWPRSEEEKSRGRNCGFVAYMSRSDAERALRALKGRDVMNYEMKLGWGKSVTVLNHPIYIPPALAEYVMPPPPSGLPFNAQPQPNDALNFPPKEYFHNYPSDPDIKRDMEEISHKCIVKVMIPTERSLLALVHRMIEFVVREGPMFEAMIMSREIDNPIFRFMFENESPAHIYYRWKLFSLLQGDTPTDWRQTEFRMFKGGAIWKPPAANFYTQGMPEELIVDPDAPEVNKGALSNAQRDRLEELIRHLTPERSRIGDAMIFCIEHAEAADEICECLDEALASASTQPNRRIARLYLVSDILHNCSVKVSNASFFRKSMERHLENMFKSMHTAYMALDSRLKAEGFRLRVLQVFKAWEEWAVYPRDFLTKLKKIFLGTQSDENSTPAAIETAPLSGDEKDDEDLDGVPLDGAALLKSAMMRGLPGSGSTQSPARIGVGEQQAQRLGNAARDDSDYEDDIDGIPMDDDIDGIPMEKLSSSNLKPGGGGFIPSKWETVDPDQIEAQAITTSKWDTLDPVAPEPPSISTDYSNDGSLDDGLSSEDKRSRLREIEVKIVQYQDELESGQRALKPGWTMNQQLEHYRRKLMRKDLLSASATQDYDSPVEGSLKKSSKKTKRSPSPSHDSTSSSSRSTVKRHTSRSPPSHYKKSKRRSRSPSIELTPHRYSSRDSPILRRHRSPSPTKLSSRSARSPDPASSSSSSSQRRSTRDASPPGRPRTADKHRHKHSKY